MKDGSLDPRQNHATKTFNRKMRMRDTFTVLFPGYQHGQYSNCSPELSTSIKAHQYPHANEDGQPTHTIDRTHTRKRDFLRDIHENFVRIENTLRPARA